MEGDGFASLTEELRQRPSAALGGLSDEHLAHFASAVRATRHRQAQQLAAASDRALNQVPRLLRGPIRKIVG